MPVWLMTGAVLLTACAPITADRGKIITAEQAQGVLWKSSAEVQQELGTPTFIDVFDGRIWVYVNEYKERFAFLDPEIKTRNVYRLVFDDNDQVVQIDHLDKDDGLDIALQERITPTRGRTLSALESLIGNIGRFRPGVPATSQ
ncbi:MAG: outer membrane protein assembly factor BamE [Pseudomonadota bacterium]